MVSRRRLRVPILVLALALVSFPAFAGTQLTSQPERGFLEALGRALAELVPAAAWLVDGLLPEAGAPEGPGGHSDESAPEGDLGSGLDPLG